MDNNDYVLKSTLDPLLDASLSNKDNLKYLMTSIQRYADMHSETLLTSDMSIRLIFAESDKKIIYQATGVDENIVKKAIHDAPSIKNTWKKATNPFYMLSLEIIHWFYMKGKSYDAYADAVTVYLGYLLYTSSHKGSWPYKPNKEVMDYTINNLNNRFLLKQYGTIQLTIEHTVIDALRGRYANELLRGSDIDYKDIISSLEARISSFISNIADEYYKNYKNKNRMYHEEDSNPDEEDNGKFHMADSISYKIDRLVQATCNSISSNGFDQNTCISPAVSMNPGCSFNKLDSILRTIAHDDMESVPELVSNILTMFMYKGTTNTIEDVKSMKFISESMQIYKSNAQDSVTNAIKATLLKWIDLAAKKYGRNFISKGKTSLDTYRRAIFSAFVFKIFASAHE